MTATDRFDDWRALCELKARYCRFLDAKDWEAWAGLFTDDFVLDTSEAGSPAPIIGRDAVVAMVRRSLETARSAHQVHNPELRISSDTAEGIWAMQDRVVFADGQGLVGYGHYIETYVRQADGWKIASTKLTRLHMDLTPAPQ